MNIYDVLLVAILAVAFTLAVKKVYSNFKTENICGGNCGSCSGCSSKKK